MVDSPILGAGLLSLMASPMAPSPGPFESASSRKRKLDASPCVDNSKASLGDPFYITPNAKSSFNTNPILLTPKAILPRLIIPLHWTVSSAQPRTFNARLTTLDTPGTILIVKYENERQLAAVERVERDKFVLLRMSSSVKLSDVRRLAILAKKSGGSEEAANLPFGMMSEAFQEEWWNAIKSEEAPAASQSGTERVEPFVGKVQMKLSEVLKSAKSPKPKPEPEVPEKKPEVKKEAKEKKTADSKFLVPPPKALNTENASPQEVLDQIRSNYFETLYIAKTPLAYFAKSTLAKARNIFRLDNQGEYARLELLKFLKSLRVPMKRQDMKYSRAIRQIANEDPIDDSTLFSEGEREYIDRWVAKTMSDDKTRGRSASQNEQRLQRKISDLRLRETEMQIILMLEILAISSKFPPAVLKALDENTETKEDENAEGSKKTKKKSKKKSKKAKKNEMTFLPEPSVHLDLLVDRLCIWQLVGSAVVLDDAPSSQQQNKDNRDHIQHFTIEVVMTYFASRLPEVCSSIKRRCSGKTPTSSYVEREAAKKEKQKAIQEQKSVKDSQSQVAQRPPSLARSVTAPASLLARTEREGSLAASIFGPGESQYTAGTGTTKPADALSSISRGGVMTSKKFDKREVQINRKKPAAAKSEDSQAKLQEVIKSAIQGIAKPNRAAAAQEFASANSQRLRVANGKKLQKPQHKPKQNVQVAATPRANRRIQHYNLSRPAVVQSPIVEEDHIPSSDAVVPQSTVKKSNKRKDFSVGIFDEELTTPTKVPRLARHMTALLPKEKNDNVGSSPMPFTRSLSDPFARAPSHRKDIVEDTPRKPKDTMMDSLVLDSPLPSGLQETPTRPSARNLLTTPSKRRFDDFNDIENSGGVMLGSPVPRAVMRSNTFSTPINKKIRSTSALGAENANGSQQSQNDENGGGGVSIYEQLGWDDY